MLQQGSYKIVAESTENFLKHEMLFDYDKHIENIHSFIDKYILEEILVAPFHVKVEIIRPAGRKDSFFWNITCFESQVF